MTPALASICEELGIVVVHPAQHRPHTPMHTAAGQTMEDILRHHGRDHLIDVLTALVESENNRHMLISPVLKAISKIMVENPSWYASGASKFLEVLDNCDIAKMHSTAKANRHIVKSREAGIATMLLGEFNKHFKPVQQKDMFT